MKPVREIVGREIIDDLWGAGYTILPRRRDVDPFFVPPGIIPQGRAYQWMHLVHDKVWISNGWAPVSADRHDGYFMPAGFIGDIEVNGLGLFEKPKFEVDEERAASLQKAKDAADPAKFFADKGFSGSVTVGTQTKAGELDTVKATKIGATKTIENTTKIPRELTPYIGQIFEERDRLYNDLVGTWNHGGLLDEWQNAIKTAYELQLSFNPDSPLGPTLNRLILPTAIENIRKRIAEEASNGQAS